jgi:hypothetical protein
LDANFELLGADPFGQIRFASLKLEGKVAGFNSDLEVLGQYTPDDPKDDSIKVFIFEYDDLENILFLGLNAIGPVWTALAIPPVPDQPNVFRRIGHYSTREI